jgi:hypothetical protein
MNELSSLAWLLFLLALIVLMFLYAQARLMAREYRRGKKKFANLNEHLEKLRETMLSESDRWPMYARPVLFTEIDREAQIEFARAQQALAEAEQILPEIETIEEPEIPDQFRLQDFFDVPKLLTTISLGNQLSGSVSALEQLILTLQHTQKSLRMNRQQVEEKRLAVEKSIEELRIRAERIGKRLKPLDVWRSLEAHNFLWVVDIAIAVGGNLQPADGVHGETGYINIPHDLCRSETFHWIASSYFWRARGSPGAMSWTPSSSTSPSRRDFCNPSCKWMRCGAAGRNSSR